MTVANQRPSVSNRLRSVSIGAVVLLGCTSVIGCSSSATKSTPATEISLVPSDTTPAPGSCDPNESVPEPTITADGTTVPATFGVGSLQCGTINGDGFIVFAYNPVLIDSSGAIVVDVGDVASATFTWDAGEPFAETSPGKWTSAKPAKGCSRLIIDVADSSGQSTATYGADIRIGGQSVDCPQRVIDTFDPTATGPISTDTLPPFDTSQVLPPSTATPSTAPPTTARATTTTTKTTTQTTTPTSTTTTTTARATPTTT